MKKLFYFFGFFLIAVLLGACFSPWKEDEDNLVIMWGNNGTTRAFVSDLDSIAYYDVILKGPGGTIQRRFSKNPSGASFSVSPGTWSVTVKGYRYITTEDYALSVLGIEQVQVTSGRKSSEIINLYTAQEISDWSGSGGNPDNLDSLIYSNNYSYNVVDPGSPPPPRPEIFLITGDLEADLTIFINRPVIIVAENPVTIKRADGHIQSFFNVFDMSGPDSLLTLGLPGMTGTITFDGSDDGVSITAPVVISGNAGIPGNFVMNAGINIKNNRAENGGGVYVSADSGFVMNGGTISGNSASSNGPAGTVPGKGGGVFVESNGTFTWNGGTISGNKPDDVYEEDQYFTVKLDIQGITESGDSVSFAAGSSILETVAQEGARVTVYYTIDNASGSITNRLTLSFINPAKNVSFNNASGSYNYTVTAADALDREIYIAASFIHTSLDILVSSDFNSINQTLTYDGLRHPVTVEYAGGINLTQAGTITEYYNASTVAPEDAGVYNITVTTTGGTVYAPAITPILVGTLTINRATGSTVTQPAVSGTPEQNSITINRVNLDTSTGQSIQYAISTVNNASPNSLTWQPDTTFTGLNPNTTYYVYARSEANINYNAGATNVSAGITTAVLSGLTAANFTVTNNTRTYNGSAQGATVTYSGGITNTQAGTITVYYDGSTTEPKDVGSYPITVITSGGTDYYAVTEQLSLGDSLTISPATLTITNITLSRSTFTPLEGETTATVTPIYGGLFFSDTATISLTTPPSGISLSGDSITYDGTSAFTNPAVTLNFSASAGSNYTSASATRTATVSVYDGQEDYTTGYDRRIPVNSSNLSRFNAYASTVDGYTLHYKLTEDIPSAGSWTPIGFKSNNGGEESWSGFSGTFDGDGYTISNLNINIDYYYGGFFSNIHTGAVVRNTGFSDVSFSIGDVDGAVDVGVVAGLNEGTVESCFVTGNGISLSNISTIGGVVGTNYTGKIQNCYTTCDITSEGVNAAAGGIVGMSDNVTVGTVENCYATGDITSDRAGGIVGIFYGGTLQNCVALNTTITSTSDSPLYVGRVVGWYNTINGILRNNYASSEMIMNPSPAVVGSDPTDKYGEVVRSDSFLTPAWWTGVGEVEAAEWYTTPPANAWDFTNIWEWGTNLPVLRGFKR